VFNERPSGQNNSRSGTFKGVTRSNSSPELSLRFCAPAIIDLGGLGLLFTSLGGEDGAMIGSWCVTSSNTGGAEPRCAETVLETRGKESFVRPIDPGLKTIP
jgi:hypothetical protein